MAIDTKSLSQLIAEFRKLKSKDAISSDCFGNNNTFLNTSSGAPCAPGRRTLINETKDVTLHKISDNQDKPNQTI